MGFSDFELIKIILSLLVIKYNLPKLFWSIELLVIKGLTLKSNKDLSLHLVANIITLSKLYFGCPGANFIFKYWLLNSVL